MKKTLTTAALSSVLVLGMASAAMAIHTTEPYQSEVTAATASKITIDGAIRMRGVIDKKDSTKDGSAATGYDGRVRLGVKAQVSPAATGYLKLETGSGFNDTYTWGSANTATGSLHEGGDKSPGSMTLLEAWINYQPSNWGVKVGHMPLALGHNVFFDHTAAGDDAVVAYINPNDSTHIAGILIKFDETLNDAAKTDHSSDLNGYVALATHKFSDSLSVGANWTYLDGGTQTNTAADYELAGGLAMSTIGLTADGKATNALSYSADVEFQFGDFSEGGATPGGLGGLGAGLASAGNTSKQIDASGYAVRLTGTMDLGAAKVGLLYGYGSGDDGTADDDQDGFINFLSNDVYNNVIIGNYRTTIPGTFTQNSGLSNLSLYQINASTNFNCPLTGKDVDLNAALSYMQLNEAKTTLTEKALLSDGITANPNAAYNGQDDDNVGTEIDVVATWHLTAGLDYKVEAAYLFTDDVYNTAAAGAGNDPDDLYFLRHRLELRF